MSIQTGARDLEQQYHWWPKNCNDQTSSVTGSDLLSSVDCRNFLKQYGNNHGTSRSHVAASRLSYHLMHPLVKGGMYGLGRWDLGLDPDFPGRSFFARASAKRGYEWGMGNDPLQLFLVSEGDRHATIKNLLLNGYGQLTEGLFKATHLSKRVLWENAAHVLVLLYPRWEKQFPEGQFSSDYQFLLGLVNDGDDELKIFSEQLNRMDRQPEPVRRSCCLNFHLEHYCEECPLVDEGLQQA